MDKNLETLILSALQEPTDAIAYSLGRELSAMFADKCVLEAKSGAFDILDYAGAGFCEIKPKDGVHSEIATVWMGADQPLSTEAVNAWFDVAWNGQDLSVLTVTWERHFQQTTAVWIVADSREVAERFLIDVSTWCSEVRGEIVVFEGGCWNKSKELFHSVQNATFDNLILHAGLKNEIQNDFAHFFASREQYEQYGVPWKRGVLFHGPPGNGKTHMLKALVNWLGKPCLYVKSFKPQRFETDHEMIRRVFARARKTTPCLLVLEDLDSIIDDTNRSFFLNELDGFASNTGVVVLATTNHPERLDPAILERPSRFDRKYAFPLPSPEERATYMSLWNEKAQPDLRLTEPAIVSIVEETDGFSFAYLKELWLSSMMRWIASPKSQTMDVVVASQVLTLKEQIATPISEPAPEADANGALRSLMAQFRM